MSSGSARSQAPDALALDPSLPARTACLRSSSPSSFLLFFLKFFRFWSGTLLITDLIPSLRASSLACVVPARALLLVGQWLSRPADVLQLPVLLRWFGGKRHVDAADFRILSIVPGVPSTITFVPTFSFLRPALRPK